MNKQQLAQKIWASANQMRSKIEASEYKDFILGFIFYKYLSDKEIEFLKDNDYDDELLKTVPRNRQMGAGKHRLFYLLQRFLLYLARHGQGF